MCKITKLWRIIGQTLVLLVCISTSIPSAHAHELEIDKANDYIAKVKAKLASNSKDFVGLKAICAQVENLNAQANVCIQEETKQLQTILELEHDSAFMDQLNHNGEDALYIKDKKKSHATKLAQCRLFSFKSHDLMVELKTTIQDISKSRILTVGEQVTDMINNKQGALLTIGFLLLFIGILYVGNSFFLRDKIRSIQITRMHKFFELKLLKFSLFLLIGSWFVLFLLQWWDVPSITVQKIKDLLVNGVTVYGIKVIPLRLLIAMLVFSLIQIVGKYLAVRVSNQTKFEDEADTQVVIGSLITYIVFALALVCALLVSGVDFTGLAIVAGALSVGIGLGLQNIVNNFVSGLILLIEKPIKPGDRIMINGIEGFVKKISIRSTRILSFLKEDVIIPNSDLISNPITNYVFQDTLSKLVCKVGVAYDSDLELVKNTLLNVALKHPDVLKDPLNDPQVILKEFGDSCLLLELGCIIKDVNKKQIISSEIHFMIVQAFRDNNIVMAFPQLDVHMV